MSEPDSEDVLTTNGIEPEDEWDARIKRVRNEVWPGEYEPEDEYLRRTR